MLDSGTGAGKLQNLCSLLSCTQPLARPGAWLLTLACRLSPTAELVGSDASHALFPSQHPPNVHFIQVSSTNLPPTWTSRFDFINQRFLSAELTTTQWGAVLSQLLRVLKPGGSIQLMEFGGIKSSGLVSSSLVATRRSDQILETVKRRRNLLVNPGLELPEMTTRAGFTHVQAHLRRLPVGAPYGDPGVKGARSAEGMIRMFAQALLDEGHTLLVASRNELESLIAAANREWDSTPGVFCDIYVITARKAM